MKQANHDRDLLLFRRQFILGPRFVEGFPTWKRVEVRPSTILTVHPDLPIHHARRNGTSIVLLGYILDPHRPEDRDADTVRRLLRHMEEDGTRESLIRLTYPLGGRWILLVDTDQTRWLFNDPCGYRQVFHAHMSSRGSWCASQPGLLAEVLDLAMDQEAVAFLRTYRRQNPQYWWPGETTPYKEICHLQPNHYLDLETGARHRFWPDRDLIPRPVEDVVLENAQLLQGIIESASRRFELALSITAGRDTRLLLAASKAICHQLYCFTLMYWDSNWKSPDIRVPSTLLPRLGLRHHVIQCPAHMDRAFKQTYRRNVTAAHDAFGAIAQGLYEYYPPGKVCMKGNAMPIATHHSLRSRLRRRQPDPDKGRIDAQTLAWLTNREDAFAVEALDRWLSEANNTNLDILDLFFWEDREGNWQAMSQSEWDIAQEVLVPYNCRLFLTNMLSVDRGHRSRPSYAIHERLMLRLWPQVLSEPINPPAKPTVVSSAVGSLERLRHKMTGMDPPIFCSPVQSAFQRFPLLTKLERVRS